jgi:hypothetical protein
VAGGSGSVTITSFTATRIKGTFTATLAAALAPATGHDVDHERDVRHRRP